MTLARRLLLEIVPLGDEKVHRVPLLTTAQALILALGRNRKPPQQIDELGVAEIEQAHSLGVAALEEHAGHPHVLPHIRTVLAERPAQCRRAVPFDLGGIEPRHVDDGLGGGEPEIGGTHEHDAGFGLAALGIEDAEVGVASTAAREPAASFLALSL